jgi:hypothetical protein
MPMFVNDDRVTLHDDAGNSIIIRAKMNMKIAAAVQDELFLIRQEGTEQVTRFTNGAREMVLLKKNVLSWSGPDFDGVPCTPENIERLDPFEPFIVRVLEEIGSRNARAVNEPDPKSSTRAGESGSMVVLDLQAVNTTSKSS